MKQTRKKYKKERKKLTNQMDRPRKNQKERKR